MKRLLIVTSSLLLAAGSVLGDATTPPLTVDGKIEFATAYVSEGRRLQDQHFAPSVEVGFPLFGAGELYLGLDAYLKTNCNKGKQSITEEGILEIEKEQWNPNLVVPYLGISYDVTDVFTVDLGYALTRFVENRNINYVYVEGERMPFSIDEEKVAQIPMKRSYHEIYLGLVADVLLNPTIYFAYDFTQKKANIEGSINHTFDLGSFGANGIAIDLGTKLGYSRAKKPFGIDRDQKIYAGVAELENKKNKLQAVLFDDESRSLFSKKCWFYVGANADLIYSLNEYIKARAGVAVSYNNASKDSWINNGHKKHNVWFSSAIEFSF